MEASEMTEPPKHSGNRAPVRPFDLRLARVRPGAVRENASGLARLELMLHTVLPRLRGDRDNPS